MVNIRRCCSPLIGHYANFIVDLLGAVSCVLLDSGITTELVRLGIVGSHVDEPEMLNEILVTQGCL